MTDWTFVYRGRPRKWGSANRPNMISQSQSTARYESRLTDNERSFVKEIYNLIRAIHHSGKISISQDRIPPSIQRLTDMLGSIIKPAMPSDSTLQWLDGNARNWAYTTRCILEDHYRSCVDSISMTLKSLQRTDWRKFFAAASRWAIRNLGCRLEKDTLQRTETLLVSLFEEQTIIDPPLDTHANNSDIQSVPDPFPGEVLPPLPKRDVATSPTIPVEQNEAIEPISSSRRLRPRRARKNPKVDTSGNQTQCQYIEGSTHGDGPAGTTD